ncbi:hypothetical protein [Halorhodospira sp. 9622]|uniref:hypothetical protein n=1 Tax=Halorhodospira sp. 9622 TaxID=2899136 RepID=UPI001EE7C468|nr:hypothetical protein [Halorhodospira sp. 9622]MCG5537335.1 hypothetical protein [Halorhodospira sp. 9622]
MGMDVVGVNPSSERGAYFRRNIWGWHPLWDTVASIAPDVADRVELPHTNDGDGLDAEGSSELAQRIDQALVDGKADESVRATSAECRRMGMPGAISLEDLLEFRDFLRDCGGFRIL